MLLQRGRDLWPPLPEVVLAVLWKQCGERCLLHKRVLLALLFGVFNRLQPSIATCYEYQTARQSQRQTHLASIHGTACEQCGDMRKETLLGCWGINHTSTRGSCVENTKESADTPSSDRFRRDPMACLCDTCPSCPSMVGSPLREWPPPLPQRRLRHHACVSTCQKRLRCDVGVV